MQIMHNTLICFCASAGSVHFKFDFCFFENIMYFCFFIIFCFFQGKFWGFLHNRAATLATTGEQVSPKSDFIKRFLPPPTTQDQTPSDFDYAGLSVVAVFKISSKYVGITRSLATRRTLGIPKLLKCVNKVQPERSRSNVLKNTAPEREPCLRKQRAPEPEPFHFCKCSAAPVLSGSFSRWQLSGWQLSRRQLSRAQLSGWQLIR